MEDRCICCGESIPEGRQVCPLCENKVMVVAEEKSAKKYLQKIVNIDMMIECKLQQVAELRNLLTGGAIRYDIDRVQTSPDGDRMTNVIAKIMELEELINNDVDKLVEYKKKARELIEKLEDDMEKIILYKRYFEKKSFEQISVECGYSWRWTISLHGNALKSFDKILNKAC